MQLALTIEPYKSSKKRNIKVSTAIVWAGHYNSQRVDSARRLTRPPHNFMVKRGSVLTNHNHIFTDQIDCRRETFKFLYIKF
ncbi:hypothetical protein SO802_012162 [Lithocarpus litseifolius]|uniref:Uncharacterized protein n=1 Tax=Lithocarpus litseifolius TaxID=425828 RepID=A0AAW2D2Q0_9ROSI